VEEGTIRPAVYPKAYTGLESVGTALTDLAARKIWGKAIITVCAEPETGGETRVRL
jgi:NADPH:quinone reductase